MTARTSAQLLRTFAWPIALLVGILGYYLFDGPARSIVNYWQRQGYESQVERPIPASEEYLSELSARNCRNDYNR